MDSSSREFSDQLRSGFVSRDGFIRLSEAEGYGNISSLGCLKSWLQDLEIPLRAGKRIDIDGERFISSFTEFIKWIEENFPDAYSCFYRDRDFPARHRK